MQPSSPNHNSAQEGTVNLPLTNMPMTRFTCAQAQQQLSRFQWKLTAICNNSFSSLLSFHRATAKRNIYRLRNRATEKVNRKMGAQCYADFSDSIRVSHTNLTKHTQIQEENPLFISQNHLMVWQQSQNNSSCNYLESSFETYTQRYPSAWTRATKFNVQKQELFRLLSLLR